MENRLFTLEKTPFLPIALFCYSATIKYLEDLRKLSLKTEEFDHAFILFSLFLFLGTLSLTCYIVLMVAKNNVSKNVEKIKEPVEDKNKKYILLDVEKLSKNPEQLESLIGSIITEKRTADTTSSLNPSRKKSK